MIFWGVLTFFACVFAYGVGRDHGKELARMNPLIRKPQLRDTAEGLPIVEWEDY